MTSRKIDRAAHAMYRANGFVVVPGALDTRDLTGLLARLARLVALQLEHLGRTPAAFTDNTSLRRNLEDLLAADVPAYLAAVRQAAKLVELQRLAVSETITELMSAFGMGLQTLPTTAVLHIIGDKLLIPGGYHGLAPHQDWPSIQGGLDSIVVWFPFTAVRSDRFPVEVIKGSHLFGVWQGEIHEHELEIKRELYCEDDFEPVPMNPGDVLLMSTFLVHRTGVAGSRGLRIAASIRYENAEEPSFVSRGYPCAYRRTVQREIIVPGFPTAAQVAALYTDA